MDRVRGLYDFKRVNGHVEVYLDGVFLFSADNLPEALREISIPVCADE